MRPAALAQIEREKSRTSISITPPYGLLDQSALASRIRFAYGHAATSRPRNLPDRPVDGELRPAHLCP